MALHFTSFLTGFLVFSSLHIVIGEQVPKTFAIRQPEPVSQWIVYPLHVSYIVFYPLNWLLNNASRTILSVPVRFEMSRMRGGDRRTEAASRSNSCQDRIDERRMERVRDDERAAANAARAANASASRADLRRRAGDDGLLRSVDRGDRRPARHAAPATATTSASGARIAAMPPPAGSDCIRRPRAATSARASSSVEHAGDARRHDIRRRSGP